MKTAAIYVRISDDREGRELGVDRQIEDCQALARREHLQVVGQYADNDISASTRGSKPRPEYDRLLADAQAGKFAVILAYTSGRITRRPREHEDLIDLAVDHGTEYLFVRSPSFDLNTAAGRRVARILAANDAGEAEDIAERVGRAVLQRAERGEPHGGPRGYGLTADGRTIVEDEAARIRGWYEHILAGGSLNSIRTDLTRQQIPTATGKPWRTPVIRKILLNPRNAGLRILAGIEYPAPHPAIVPVQTWRAARQLLEAPGRTAHHAGTARKHVGTGLFRCLRCDVTVNANYDVRGNLLYRCLTCYRTWRADPINAWIADLAAEMLKREDAHERLLPKPRKGVDIRALHTEAAAIRANLADLTAEYALARGATREAMKAGLRAGETRLAEIDTELADAGRVDAVAALLAADDPAEAWYSIEDVARRQAVLRSMMTVRLDAPIRGRAAWDPRKFMGASQWTGDSRTWGEHWIEQQQAVLSEGS